MESFSGDILPWKKVKFFNRTSINTYDMPDILELDSKQIQYITSEEEITLLEYRSRINEYETHLTNGKNWEYYKKIVNPFELVYTQKKYDDFPESVCFLKPLSRSYFKMIELLDIMHFFNLFKGENLRAAHVCEGPGGFIEALFDEAFKNKKHVQTSVAMTLKSRQVNIPGWKRASQFLQKNPCIKILYGDDGTGDILKPENQQYFVDYFADSKIHIFTADGGFDFSCDYTKQEEMIFPLLIASVKIGFEILKKGGVFILKFFDFYHKATTDLLYFLSCYFQEWTLYKPAISRPCNPEQYFIGKGFIGCSSETMDIMRLWCSYIEHGQPLESLFKVEYNSEFKSLINQLRSDSFKIQTDYLEKVFFIIDKNDAEIIKKYLRKNELMSYEWCLKFKVPICGSHYHPFYHLTAE